MKFYLKNMQFNFKNYITEKYLNEAIQSDIFINKLLNDKGGLFKFYKYPYSKYFNNIDNIYKNILNLSKEIFYK